MTNISTRRILRLFESTKICFQPGFGPGRSGELTTLPTLSSQLGEENSYFISLQRLCSLGFYGAIEICILLLLLLLL